MTDSLKYDIALENQVHPAFLEVLYEAKVPETQVNYLVSNQIRNLASFVDLADTRGEVADKIARPAGVDHTSAFAVQPLKTAWRIADSIVKAQLEAKARGEDVKTTRTLPEGTRLRIDTNFKKHFKIIFPPTWQPSDETIAAVKDLLDKRKTRALELRKVKCLVEMPEAKGVLLQLDPATAPKVQEHGSGDPVTGLWVFQYKHRTLILAYTMAMAPNWEKADLSVLIEYHEFVMSKALESVRGQRPQVGTILQADYETRTRWQLFLSLDANRNLTEAVKDTSANYGHLWSNIHAAALPAPLISVGDQTHGRQQQGKGFKTGGSEVRDRSRTLPPPPNPAATWEGQWGPGGQSGWHSAGKGKGAGVGQEKGTPRKGTAQGSHNVVKKDPDGNWICAFWNKAKCLKGDACTNRHCCNLEGCFGQHVRVAYHS